MKKKFFIIIIGFFLILQSSLNANEFQEIFDSISEVQEKYNELDKSDILKEQKIDLAILEANKITDIVKSSLNENDEEKALKVIDFLERSLNSVSSTIPQEITSDMKNIDMSKFAKEKLDIVNSITENMKNTKASKFNETVTNLFELQEQGVNLIEINTNLDELGFEVVKLTADVKGQEKISNWTKEEWAASWKGDILSDDKKGEEVVVDTELLDKTKNLEIDLQNNNKELASKRSSLSALNNQINPLNNELQSLKQQKESVLNQYNNQIAKQSLSILSQTEINANKEKISELSSQLENLNTQIINNKDKSIEFQSQIDTLNLEISESVLQKQQLEREINNLNDQILNSKSLLEKNEIKIENIKARDYGKEISSLQEDLSKKTLERDFIVNDFEKSIDKEVDALKYYGTALGDINSSSFELEAEFAMREFQVILEADPKKQRQFDLEKYATFAGLSKSTISEGIKAIENDNWDRQKEITLEIYDGLAKNPEWIVDKPSASELNVWLQEEKTIQKALTLANEAKNLKDQIDQSITTKTKDLRDLSNLSTTTINYAAMYEAQPEYSFFQDELKSTISKYGIEETKALIAEKQKNSNRTWQSINEINSLYSKLSRDEYKAGREARANLIEKVNEAKKQIEIITNVETQPLREYETKIKETINEVPTLKGTFTGLDDPARLLAALNDKSNPDESVLEAYDAAKKAMSEIGETPSSKYLTGPYWEMSNVKAAAIVRSKKYDYVDDYAYLNAYYSPIEFDTQTRAEAEQELKNILAKENPKLDAIQANISQINSELSNLKSSEKEAQINLKNLTAQLTDLKNNEKDLQNKLNSLSSNFSSKEQLILDKKNQLNKLASSLNPINENLNKLNQEKLNLDEKFDKEAKALADSLKNQNINNATLTSLQIESEKEVKLIDEKINSLELKSQEIQSEIAGLSKEINTIETKNPVINQQLVDLKNQIDEIKNIKAELAITEAQNHGLLINKIVENRVVSRVSKLDNKSLVQIDGTSMMKVVDTNSLKDEAGNFKTPKGSFSLAGNVYSSGAMDRTALFSVSAIDKVGDVKVSVSKAAAEKINEGLFDLTTATGLVANDKMGEGVYTMVDPKTGRQVIDSHTGQALYGGQVGTGKNFSINSTLGKMAAKQGYVFVKQAGINQGTMCSSGDCVFNIDKKDLETFNKTTAASIDTSGIAFDQALNNSFVNASVNNLGIVNEIGQSKQFYSGRFNALTDVDGLKGSQALLEKAQKNLASLENSNASEMQKSIAAAQVDAEKQVVEVVAAAQQAAAQAATVAAASASSEAVQQVAQEVQQTLNVNQLIQYADGSLHHITSKTGVNLSAGQTVVWTGTTTASHGAYGSDDKNQAVKEAAEAYGVDESEIYNPQN